MQSPVAGKSVHQQVATQEIQPLQDSHTRRFPPVQAGARHPRELVDGIPVVHVHRRGAWLPVRAFKRLVEMLVAMVVLMVLGGLGTFVFLRWVRGREERALEEEGERAALTPGAGTG